jgi:hypothetical protein
MFTRTSTRRCERRILKIQAAELSCPDESASKERTFTENVSPRGVRITTMRRWQPGSHVLVTFLPNGVPFQGTVAYCQREESGTFAAGLELPWDMERWQMLW